MTRRAPHTRPLVAAALSCAAWLLASTAAAHPIVDEGRESMQRAEFDAALDAFARAEQADDLTLEDLVDLLDARAMVYLATGDSDGLDRDLAALASIDPSHRFGPEAPPELSDALADLTSTSNGAITVRAEARPVPEGVEVSARAQNDPGSLVRAMRVWTRQGHGAWRRAAASLVTLAAGTTLSYYVEAIGPGGAVVAHAGTRSEPLVSDAALGGAAAPIRGDEGGGGVSLWVWLGLGAAAVAGGVLLALLLAGGGGGGTQPNAPVVVGF